ncbi:MAG: aryl-sulfate sulfotransferase [Saprospiraceae bacterium]|jgi:hypothetical protein|nr:aryl-sulfate sulfotransferase [Saprospiraceae bacterium]
MFKNQLLSCFFISLFAFPSFSQTLGTLKNTEESLQGYTFFSPFSSTRAYMVDNCGQLVNRWDRGTRPGLAAYFLENGLMLRTYKPAPAGPFTSASNAGGLELVDWDNNTVWSYEFNTPTWISHHDAVYMPNGNMLVLTWDLVYTDELIEMGRDPDEIAPEGYMWSERIIEVEPIGSNDMNIVWQWEVKHHYIQDFDSTKLNYGVVADHPELFNINLPELSSSNSNSSRDWNHMNAIDYNPHLDQILLSVRNSDEIWIIDHSTTTNEATTHNGGLYGKGGDILYRWGNPSAYNRAQLSDQKLFGQHGVNWIKNGLEDAGKIMIFNNGNGRPGPDFSTGEVLTPPQDANGGYLVPNTDPFGPATSQKVFGNMPGETFYSAYLSNIQRLPNGNTLLNAGSPGSIFEITPDREIVWDYLIPLNGDSPYIQGQNPNNNSTFRAYRFAPDFPGFEGIDLTPSGTIELGNSPVNCDVSTSINELEGTFEIDVSYLQSTHILKIQNPNLLPLNVSVFDISGRQFFEKKTSEGEDNIEILDLNKGIYFVRVLSEQNGFLTKKILIF